MVLICILAYTLRLNTVPHPTLTELHKNCSFLRLMGRLFVRCSVNKDSLMTNNSLNWNVKQLRPFFRLRTSQPILFSLAEQFSAIPPLLRNHYRLSCWHFRLVFQLDQSYRSMLFELRCVSIAPRCSCREMTQSERLKDDAAPICRLKVRLVDDFTMKEQLDLVRTKTQFDSWIWYTTQWCQRLRGLN